MEFIPAASYFIDDVPLLIDGSVAIAFGNDPDTDEVVDPESYGGSLRYSGNVRPNGQNLRAMQSLYTGTNSARVEEAQTHVYIPVEEAPFSFKIQVTSETEDNFAERSSVGISSATMVWSTITLLLLSGMSLCQ